MFNKMIINRTNLINNVKQVKQKNPNSLVCAMVKANAYGVGLKQVVQTINNYVDFFGVACFFEAKKVKQYATKKILIVGVLEKSNLDTSFSYTCSCLEDVEFLISQNQRYDIHLKVNTGMNRFGFKNLKEFKLALQKIKKSKLNLEGVYTHFATDDSYVDAQFKIFKQYIRATKKYKFSPLFHADNSIVNAKFNHNLDMVRIGFDLYNSNNNNFKSVVQIKTTVVQINTVKKGELVGYNKRFIASKKIKVAVLPIGYADGFLLCYLGLNLNIEGKICKVLNICMDCIMIDITNLDIKKGQSVYILNNLNPINLYSSYANSSDYEVLTNFSKMRCVRVLTPIASK